MIRNNLAIRAPRADEFDGWAVLFRGYRAFYKLAADEAIVERVWGWVHDPDCETGALIAVDDDSQILGLAHYRRFARPSTGSIGVWLDDLFTDTQHRGNGIGRLLIEAVTETGQRDGCSIVRWITAADNR